MVEVAYVRMHTYTVASVVPGRFIFHLLFLLYLPDQIFFQTPFLEAFQVEIWVTRAEWSEISRENDWVRWGRRGDKRMISLVRRAGAEGFSPWMVPGD